MRDKSGFKQREIGDLKTIQKKTDVDLRNVKDRDKVLDFRYTSQFNGLI